MRILADEKVRRGVGYKSYKGLQFSEQVFVISKKTKKKPVKYRVGGKWYLQSSLLKSAVRDRKSQKLIEKRDKDAEDRDKKYAEKREVEAKKRDIEKAKKFAAGEKATRGSAAFRAKMKAMREKDKRASEIIERAEDEFQKKKLKPKVAKPKVVKPKVAKPADNGFKKLLTKFRSLVRWFRGEEKKSYAGPHEQELGAIYNAKIHEGRAIVARLKKRYTVQANKVNLEYFKDFEI